MKKDCRFLRKEQRNGKGEEKNNDNGTTTTISEDVIVFSACKDNCNTITWSSSDWTIDTGASFHATPNKDSFTTYKVGDFGNCKNGE